MHRRIMFMLLAVVAGMALAAGPAMASDASLRVVVRQQEKAYVPDIKALAVTTDRMVAGKATVDDLKLAVGKLIQDADAYRAAIAPERASTARVAAGKRRLALSLRELKGGLLKFNKALSEVQARDKRAARTMRSARVEILTAERHNRVALKLILVKA